jgi:hypothetical protein
MEINESGDRYSRANEELEARVLANGFERYTYAPFQRQLLPDIRAKGSGTGNAIFVRNREAVESRLREAPPFRVLGQHI